MDFGSSTLFKTLAADVRDGTLVVEAGSQDAALFFAVARAAHALLVVPDRTRWAELTRSFAAAGVCDEVAFRPAVGVSGPATTPYTQSLQTAEGDVLLLDTFGVDRPVSLIRLSGDAATMEVAEAISPTLLQRDAPAICFEGSEPDATRLSRRWAPFGYQPQPIGGGVLFRCQGFAAGSLHSASVEDLIADRVMQRLLPRLEAMLAGRVPARDGKAADTRAADVAAVPAAPVPEAVRPPARTPALQVAHATLNHLVMTPHAISQWRADGRVQASTAEGVVFGASGKLHLASASFAVEPDVFYTLALHGQMLAGDGLVRVLVMDDTVGIPVACREMRAKAEEAFRTNCEFRALHRSSTLHLRIELPQARSGDQVRFGLVNISRIGATKAVAHLESGLDRAMPIASMASVVGRDEMMLDAVSTLYRQCSKIRIYLNRHTDLPSYLDDPRIEVAWSSDHGDMGDTGKFFWAEDKTPGPRLVVDDDFIFPTDFSSHMVDKLKHYDRRAMIGVHGIMLRQPLLKSYYDPTARFINRYVIGLGSDLPVHTVGTGAVCYDPDKFKLLLNDFPFNNMADIWVMLASQRQNIPIIAASRPYHWLIDNKTTAPSESIFKASSSGSDNAFNTAKMQTHVTRLAWPITIRRRFSAGVATRKALLLLEALGDAETAMAALCAWWNTRPRWFDWVAVLIAPDEQTEIALQAMLADANLPCELHVVGTTALKRQVSVADLVATLKAIDHDVGVRFAPGVQPNGKGWHPILAEAEKGGLIELRGGDGANPDPAVLAWTGATLAELFNHLGDAVAAHNWAGSLLATAEIRKRRSVSRVQATEAVLHVGDISAAARLPGTLDDAAPGGALRRDLRPAWRDWPSTIRINDVAERVFLLNLDRRPDRLRLFTQQADLIGLEFERFSAIDGSKDPHLSEWQTYMQQPITPFPKGTAPFKWEWDLYNKYLSDNHRIAHYEHKLGRKIMSKGAWGYQKSMIEIIGRAIENDWESVLIFDDDCLFHRDIVTLFDQRMRQVPSDWIMLNLGVLQYAWEGKWINWNGDGLYHCRGSSVGSHAVLLHREAYPAVMTSAVRMDLPFDTGALHSVKRKYANKCFVFFPNLFIQNVDDSDIGDSAVQLAEGGQAGNKYRWTLSDYTAPSA